MTLRFISLLMLHPLLPPFSKAAVCSMSSCPTIPYRSIADNPFRAGMEAGTMFLEDFEDGRANTPFLYEGDDIAPGGRNTIGVTQFLTGENNSVDGDDGIPDGADLLGIAWMGTLRGVGSISFVFEPRVLPDGRQQFPTWFGFAVTAGYAGLNVNGFYPLVQFTDEQEHFLGSYQLRPDSFPEYHAGQRGVNTDRFVSFYVPTGAEIMHIDGTIYTIDHLTYGWGSIPEPGVVGLSTLGLLFVFRRRRKSRCVEAVVSGAARFRPAKLAAAPLCAAGACLFTSAALHAGVTLVDWNHEWDYMHPANGVLPPGSGATEPNAGPVKWYAPQAEFDAGYTGPGFVFWAATPDYEAGRGPGPIGYELITYFGYPQPPPGEFSSYGTWLIPREGGVRLTAYVRTTFIVPDDGGHYVNPVIRYLQDDGGWVYLDGSAVLRINMPATEMDVYLATALNADTEFSIREADLSRGAGAETGGNSALTPPVRDNAFVLRSVTSLSPGVHTLAVSLHNSHPNSNDLALALQLRADRIADTDLDGMADAWEDAHGLLRTDPADRNLDKDGDGQTNYQEFLAGTAADDVTSRLVIKDFSVTGNSATLLWDSVPGKVYRIDLSTAGGSWRDTGVDFPAAPSPAGTTSSGPLTIRNFFGPPAVMVRVRVRH